MEWKGGRVRSERNRERNRTTRRGDSDYHDTRHTRTITSSSSHHYKLVPGDPDLRRDDIFNLTLLCILLLLHHHLLRLLFKVISRPAVQLSHSSLTFPWDIFARILLLKLDLICFACLFSFNDLSVCSLSVC